MNYLKMEDGVINVKAKTEDIIEVDVVIDDSTNIDVPIITGDSAFKVAVNGDIETKVTLDATAHEISSTKHNELQNRNLPDQHNIDSITGLRNELNEIKNSAIKSYNDLTDKPKINDVELKGNKTEMDLGVSSIDIIELEAILN